MFLDGERAHEEILLLDVARELTHEVAIDGETVDAPLTRHGQLARVAKCQAVQQSGFAGPTSAHDGQKLARSHHTAN